MSPKHDALEAALVVTLGDLAKKISSDHGQLILDVEASALAAAMKKLRDEPSLGFAQLIDACGVDYAEWGGNWSGLRYAVVYQLLSIEHNWRIRVRTFCPENEFPMVESMTPLWRSADWYEREAFDLFGIVFAGHNDLRRILTDYGFVGHPFRKDFPIYGNVEMRYDPEQRRVIYQPVTIEPREIVPRVIREENYASGASDSSGAKR